MNNFLELSFNEKKEIFQLLTYKHELEHFTTLLITSNNIFLSHDRKKTLVNSLKFCEEHSLKISRINIKDTIEIISKLNQIPLDAVFRDQLFKQITKLIKYFHDFERIILKNDTERFYLMLEGRFLLTKYSNDLLNFGIVSVNGLTPKQQLKLSGTLIPEKFYSCITSCWQFENPSLYFDYSQVNHPLICRI